MTSEDDFAPIWEESILLEEHEAVQASVDVGGWLSAALDDPNVCEQMKADINRWFSAGFLYLDSVRQLMQADREAVRAEQAAYLAKARKEAGQNHDLHMAAVNEVVNLKAELAKFKALAETLAGALEAIRSEAQREEGSWLHLKRCIAAQSAEALREYKEAHDAKFGGRDGERKKNAFLQASSHDLTGP